MIGNKGNTNSYPGDKNPNHRHGMRNSRIYRIWRGMNARCKNPKEISFPNYGGRGIKVCERWAKFENFYEDMKRGYNDTMTIERIDYNGEYCKENCKWIPKGLQSRNTRRNIEIEFEGKKWRLYDLSEKYEINYHTLYNRIFIYGISVKDALTKKHMRFGQKKAKEFLAGLLGNIKENE